MILRNVLSQFFIVKCFSKSLLVRILKRDNQLHFFRSLEKCSKRLTKCEGAIEFLRLCLNFGVTPTFAQVERRKARKWRKSSENYQKAVMEEELRSKLTQLKHLREVQNAYKDVREECSLLRFVTIVRTYSSQQSVHRNNEMSCQQDLTLDLKEV